MVGNLQVCCDEVNPLKTTRTAGVEREELKEERLQVEKKKLMKESDKLMVLESRHGVSLL